MKVSYIIFFAIVYVISIIFILFKASLPRQYTLFGQTYGKKFAEMSFEQKLTVIGVYFGFTISMAAHLILPTYVIFIYPPSIVKEPLLALLCLFVSIVIQLILLVNVNDKGKAFYKKKVKKILSSTPLLSETIKYLTDHPEIKIVLPCNDGIAFYSNRPREKEDEHEMDENDYMSFEFPVVGESLKEFADNWEKAKEKKYSSCLTCGCDFYLSAKDFGLSALSESDVEEARNYLASVKSLGLRSDTLSFERPLAQQYTKTKTVYNKYNEEIYSRSTDHYKYDVGVCDIDVLKRK